MLNTEYTFYSLQKRTFALMVAIASIFLALFIRLVYLQGFFAFSLQHKALDQWTRDLPITAERGVIYDSNGAALAVSYSSYDVYVRSREVQNKTNLAKILAEKLGCNYTSVLNKISLTNVSEVLIKMQISSTLAKNIMNLDLKGVYFAESIDRFYPYGNLATQIVGFTTVDNVGQSGIEAYYNKILKGVDGQVFVQSDLRGLEIDNSLQTYTNPTDGTDVFLTIDVAMQNIVENALNKVMLEQKPKGASAILMNAKTGEILASSSKPSYSLNNIPRDDVAALMEMSKNKLVSDVYEPGSTFKILTMAAALDAGVAHLTDTFNCGGAAIVDGQRIKCWKSKGHGHQTLTEGIVNSCNCVFMELAQRLGTERLYDYIEKLGIGSKTGADFVSESSGIVMPKNVVKNVDLARIGFGHAIAVTPIQLITAVAAVVNGGNLVVPHITKSIGNNSQYTPQFKQTNVVSKDISSTLNAMLAKVVNKQQPYSFVAGYDVGGKTGTAQKYQNGAIAQGKYISSFIGTYPASNPDYILLLLVDEASAGAYYGSIVAAPYGKLIFEDIINYYQFKKVEDVEKRFEIMPNVTSLSIEKALNLLDRQNITYELYGNGNTIEKQLPPAGTKIDASLDVVLITD